MRRLALVLVLAVALGTASADVVSTDPYWNGHSGVAPFGNPNTATYGQTITAGASDDFLHNFSFHMIGGDAPFSFQAFVMNWNGTRATGGPLYASSPTVYTPDQNNYQTFAFDTGNLAITPGQQYVMFFSVSAIYDPFGGGSTAMGLVLSDDPGSDYTGGHFVFLNNGGDTSQWTNTDWNNFGGEDLAFTENAVPEPTSLMLLGSGLLGIAGSLRKRLA